LVAAALDVEPELHRIASPIDISTMRDVDDPNDDSIAEDLVNHPELAPPRRVPTLKLIAKWLAHAVGIFRERAPYEFPTRDGHCLG
jgi:hypothetical protein